MTLSKQEMAELVARDIAPGSFVNLGIGQPTMVTWTGNLGPSEHVQLEVSHDGGVTWHIIAADVQNSMATGGAFQWIAEGPAGAARIRATWVRNPAVQSVTSFTIK